MTALKVQMISVLLAALGLAIVAAQPAQAGLQGATYKFSAATTSKTQIGAVAGTYTDPANPGFCVGPPVFCSVGGSGLSGAFTFSDVSPSAATITFTFYGSTASASGSFAIDLSDFVLTDGEKITNVTYDNGNLGGGDFTNVSWNGAMPYLLAQPIPLTGPMAGPASFLTWPSPCQSRRLGR